MGYKKVKIRRSFAALDSLYQVANNRKARADRKGAGVDDDVGDAVERLAPQEADNIPSTNDGTVAPKDLNSIST